MTAARITTHAEGGSTSWQLAVRDACPAVRGLVPSYVGYAEACATPVRRLEVPHPNVTLIINLGEPLAVRAPSLPAVAGRFRSFTAGLFDTVVETETVRASCGIELNVAPPAMWQLFGVRMAELANAVVSLRDLIGDAADDLEDRLRAAADWDTRFDLLDRALAARCARRALPREVAWAWDALARSSGDAAVSHIAAELQWSRRRLVESFREHVGVPPKTVARLMRFDRAAQAVRSGRTTRWSTLALDCGYADQSHMIREFTALAGLSPTAFAARVGSTGIRAD